MPTLYSSFHSKGSGDTVPAISSQFRVKLLTVKLHP
jgi:hypothetical protein